MNKDSSISSNLLKSSSPYSMSCHISVRRDSKRIFRDEKYERLLAYPRKFSSSSAWVEYRYGELLLQEGKVLSWSPLDET